MFGIGNPQWLLQPWKNLKQFTESLYAALDAARNEPLTHEGPVVIRVPEGQAALRIERRSADARDLLRPDSRPRTASPASAQDLNPVRGRTKRQEPPGRAQGPRGRSTDSEARLAPGVDTEPPTRRERGQHVPIDGAIEFSSKEPVRFAKPPQVWSDSKKEWYTPKPWEYPEDLPFPMIGGGGGGTNVFIGRVTSSSPGETQCDLYPSGPDGDKLDGGPFTINMPTLDPNETFEIGDWIYGIFAFSGSHGTEYYAQPPSWIA